MEKQKYIHIDDNGTMTIGDTDPVTFDDFIEDSQITSENLPKREGQESRYIPYDITIDESDYQRYVKEPSFSFEETKEKLEGVDSTGDRKSHLHKMPYQNVEKVVFDSIARISQYGFNKYGCYDSWQSQVDIDVYYGALLRHLMADLDGELLDTESGLSHLDHALWNLQAILWLREKKEMYRANQYNVQESINEFDLETTATDSDVNQVLYGKKIVGFAIDGETYQNYDYDDMGNRTGELSD